VRRLAAPAVTVAALVLAVVAVVVAVRAGDRADAAKRALREAQARGAVNRTVLADSEAQLCGRVYSQLTLLEKVSAKQETLSFYRRILPDIPLRTIKRLLANAHKQTKLALAELSPTHCSDLPSQRLTTPGALAGH
jgi:hypothetical protein